MVNTKPTTRKTGSTDSKKETVNAVRFSDDTPITLKIGDWSCIIFKVGKPRNAWRHVPRMLRLIPILLWQMLLLLQMA